MKLSLLTTVSAFTTEQRAVREVEEKDAKRYKQLKEMMTNYNPYFDQRKFWTYGCHCLMLSDRPMSQMHYGQPVDKLDTTCKAYKDCQRCVREKHSDQCIGEFVEYQYGTINNQGDHKYCKDEPGSCDRDLCECDLAFAKAHAIHSTEFKEEFHTFYGDFDNEKECTKSNGKGSDMQCCQANDASTAFKWYNDIVKQCCDNGEVKSRGDTC